jgi:serine/threonine protein kinase
VVDRGRCPAVGRSVGDAEGIEFDQSGNAYAGGFEKNEKQKRSGTGVLLKAGRGLPPYIYDGEWMHGVPHGYGIELTHDSFFTGRFHRGERTHDGSLLEIASFCPRHRTSKSSSAGSSSAASTAASAGATALDLGCPCNPGCWTHEEVMSFVESLRLPTSMLDEMRDAHINGAELLRWSRGPNVALRVLGRALRAVSHSAVPPIGPPPPTAEFADITYGSFSITGGNGSVKHAYLETISTEVAVKSSLSSTGNEIMKEAVVLRAMSDHPHIVKFVGILESLAWSERPGVSLLLQWEDWTVYDALHRSSVAFGVLDTVQVGSGIFSGLAHIHAHNILHLDLKSPNILLSENMVPRICDFGHCSFRDDSSPARPCCIVGTPHWAAPEVLGEVDVGFPADVWSAGMLLYEMAECRIPLEGFSYSQVIIAVVFSEIAVDLPPEYPSGLHDVIVECLQRDPGRRPKTEAAAARLDELVAKPRGEALRELVDFCDGGSEGFEGHHGVPEWRGTTPVPEAAAFPGCWVGLTSFLWKSIWG